MWGILPVELVMRQLVPAGNPGVLQHLLGRVALVGIHVQHVWQQILQGREHKHCSVQSISGGLGSSRDGSSESSTLCGGVYTMAAHREQHTNGIILCPDTAEAQNNVWYYWGSSTEPALMAKQLTAVPFMFIMNIIFKRLEILFKCSRQILWRNAIICKSLSPFSFCTLGSAASLLQMNSGAVRHQQGIFPARNHIKHKANSNGHLFLPVRSISNKLLINYNVGPKERWVGRAQNRDSNSLK